jgi:anti-sigma B factor antagonist
MDRPPTRFEIASSGGTTVVAVEGDLDSDSAPQLRATLAREFDSEQTVIVDLARCPFLDSVGIGVLVYGWKTADGQGDRFYLRNVGPYAQRVLDLVGLSDLIPVA